MVGENGAKVSPQILNRAQLKATGLELVPAGLVQQLGFRKKEKNRVKSKNFVTLKI